MQAITPGKYDCLDKNACTDSGILFDCQLGQFLCQLSHFGKNKIFKIISPQMSNQK